MTDTDHGVRTPCANEPDLFFSENAAHARAAAIGCSHCPLLLQCRLEGLVHNEYGTWGGLSRNQRSRMGVEGRAREIARLRVVLAMQEEE